MHEQDPTNRKEREAQTASLQIAFKKLLRDNGLTIENLVPPQEALSEIPKATDLIEQLRQLQELIDMAKATGNPDHIQKAEKAIQKIIEKQNV